MSDFFVPDFDAVDGEGRNVCPAGRHNATATKIEAETSRNGRPMMVIEWTVDDGEGAGHTIVDYITFGLRGLFGEARLKRICTAAGFRWQQRADLKSFVAQFPAGRLRVSVLVEHQFSIESNTGWITVDEAAYNTFTGKKNIRAVVADDFHNDYQGATAPASLKVAQVHDGPAVQAPPSAEPALGDNLPF